MVRTVKLNKTMWYILNSKDTDEFISKCADRISIKNTPRKVNMYKIMRYTKKPVFDYKGIHNPAKLNISSDTLQKIKDKRKATN